MASLTQIEGKYEILEKLHDGGMGSIYRVRHRLLEEERVIKTMRRQLAEDEQFRHRFLKEAQVAASLKHPNIAQIHDFTVDDSGTGFIVMEYIDGVSLKEILVASGAPKLEPSLEIARQALRALGFLHRKGYVHRDISPDNVMLCEDVDGRPEVKLIDLGIAKKLGTGEGLTTTGHFLGKLRYSSPEHFGEKGAAGADERSDVYSFGLVLYELLTGHQAVLGNDLPSLSAGHLLRPPQSFDQTDPEGKVPQALRQLVLRALDKDPDARFADAEIFAKALLDVQVAHSLSSDFAVTSLLAPARELRRKRLEAVAGGSTQIRLDRQFGLETTPTGKRDDTDVSRTRETEIRLVRHEDPSPEEDTGVYETISGHLASSEEGLDEGRTRRIPDIAAHLAASGVFPDPEATQATSEPPGDLAAEDATYRLDISRFSDPEIAFPEGVSPDRTADATHRFDPSRHGETTGAPLRSGDELSTTGEDFPEATRRLPVADHLLAPPADPQPPGRDSTQGIEASDPGVLAAWEEGLAESKQSSEPVDPSPVDPSPVDPSPVDLSPVDPSPVDPSPVDPSPVDSFQSPLPGPAKAGEPPLPPLPGTVPSPPSASVSPSGAGRGLEPIQPTRGEIPSPTSTAETEPAAGGEPTVPRGEQDGWTARVGEVLDRFPMLEKSGLDLERRRRLLATLQRHRLSLLGGAVGAAILVLVLVVALGGGEAPRPAPPPPPPVETVPPPPAPQPVVESEPALHPELVAARSCLEEGDAECARQAIETLGDGSVYLTDPEREELAAISAEVEAIEAAIAESTADLESLGQKLVDSLAAGPVTDLRDAVDALKTLRDEDREAFDSLDETVRTAFAEADKIIIEYRRMWGFKNKDDHFEVIPLTERLMEIYPPYTEFAEQHRQTAAEAVEARASELETADDLLGAASQLRLLREVFPERAGLDQRIAELERRQQVDETVEAALAEAEAARQQREPEKGLAVLAALDLPADGSYDARVERARSSLQDLFDTMDRSAPVVGLRPGTELTYRRKETIRVELTIVDEYRVERVEAFVRAGTEGDFAPTTLTHGEDTTYILEIVPEMHDNKRQVQFYVRAADPSGHTTSFGTEAQPKTIERKGLF